LSLGEGGRNSYTNMQPLCMRCQSRKAREENVRFAKLRKECYALEHDETCNFDATSTVGREGTHGSQKFF
jgi:hypothetical protein